MHARKKVGGEGVIAEVDARKQKLNVPKPLKLVAKGVEQVDLVQGKEEAKTDSKKPVGDKPKPAEKVEKPDKKLETKKGLKTVDEKKNNIEKVEKKPVEEKKTKPAPEEKKTKPAAPEKKPAKPESTAQSDKKVGLKAPASKSDPKEVEKTAKQIAIGKIGNPVADAEQRKLKQAIAADQSEPAEEVVSAKESPKKEAIIGEDSALNIPQAIEETQTEDVQLLDETDPTEEATTLPVLQSEDTPKDE